MKAKPVLLMAAASLLITKLVAQTYSVDWFTIDGGGGTSTGAIYSISGTVGQPDAGLTMSSGTYSLTGGFWSILAVQTPGAPLLSVRLTTTNTVVVSWPLSATGYMLQQNFDLSTTNWTVPSEPVTNDGTDKFIIVNPPTGNRYYRLHNP